MSWRALVGDGGRQVPGLDHVAPSGGQQQVVLRAEVQHAQLVLDCDLRVRQEVHVTVGIEEYRRVELPKHHPAIGPSEHRGLDGLFLAPENAEPRWA